MKFQRIVIKSNQEEAIEGLTAEYPYVLHHADFSNMTVPWHWHEEVEFDFILSGGLEVVTSNQTYTFKKGEAFFVNTNVLCCMRRAREMEAAVVDSHLFHPVFLGGHFKSIFETKYINPVLQNKKLDLLEIRGTSDGQRRILRKLQQISFLQKQSDAEFQTRSLFSDVWLLLLEEIKSLPEDFHSVNLQNQERMQSMLSYIHQNYGEKIALSGIAAAAAVSTRECLRCFQSVIHKTPIEYLMDYRVEMAKKMLRSTDRSVTEIGLQTGFSTNSYFGKAFKEKCGITPGEYRREGVGGADIFLDSLRVPKGAESTCIHKTELILR